MPAERDPLSVRYDTAVRRVLLAAIRAHRLNKGVQVWVSSPSPELRNLDAGGRTKSERAFTRSAYYQVMKVGTRYWSLKLTWGPLEKRGSRWGRMARVRLYRAGSGYRKVQKTPGTAWWNDPAKRSHVGNRAPAQ